LCQRRIWLFCKANVNDNENFKILGGKIMKGGYESMVWIRDNDGREFVCYLDDIHNDHELNDEERKNCMDVSLLIGTERW
jgi:hypothetical protein